MSDTLGDALLAAQDYAEEAEEAFREMVREALDRGVSTRRVASLLGWSHSTLWRWAVLGKPRVTAEGVPMAGAPTPDPLDVPR